MTDLILDKNGDLHFKEGDLQVDFSDNQNQHLILLTNQGEWKASPVLGVGIVELLNSEDPDTVLMQAKRHLQYDGMNVKNIRFTEKGKLNIDAKYTDNGR